MQATQNAFQGLNLVIYKPADLKLVKKESLLLHFIEISTFFKRKKKLNAGNLLKIEHYKSSSKKSEVYLNQTSNFLNNIV